MISLYTLSKIVGIVPWVVVYQFAVNSFGFKYNFRVSAGLFAFQVTGTFLMIYLKIYQG